MRPQSVFVWLVAEPPPAAAGLADDAVEAAAAGLETLGGVGLEVPAEEHAARAKTRPIRSANTGRLARRRRSKVIDPILPRHLGSNVWILRSEGDRMTGTAEDPILTADGCADGRPGRHLACLVYVAAPTLGLYYEPLAVAYTVPTLGLGRYRATCASHRSRATAVSAICRRVATLVAALIIGSLAIVIPKGCLQPEPGPGRSTGPVTPNRQGPSSLLVLDGSHRTVMAGCPRAVYIGYPPFTGSRRDGDLPAEASTARTRAGLTMSASSRFCGVRADRATTDHPTNDGEKTAHGATSIVIGVQCRHQDMTGPRHPQATGSCGREAPLTGASGGSAARHASRVPPIVPSPPKATRRRFCVLRTGRLDREDRRQQAEDEKHREGDERPGPDRRRRRSGASVRACRCDAAMCVCVS